VYGASVGSRAAALSAGAGLVLVAASIAVPGLTGWDIHADWPPIIAYWDPRIGLMTLPAIVIGLAMVLLLPRLAQRLSWGALLGMAWASTWVWTMALAMTEGTDGLARIFERHTEYVWDAQRVPAIGPMLRTYIDRIPLDSFHHWLIHPAGHPPGALLFFVLLDRLGISDTFWIGFVVVAIGSTAIVAVLIALRALGSQSLSRGAMPWIALAPSAVWMGVSGDAVFTAVAAWGLALLALAATTSSTRRRALAAVGAGLVLGLCVYLSYGLVLLGILALAVLLTARSWRALPWALGGSAVVVALFTAAGFAWWKAYPVLVERYYAGIGSDRPYSYWVWADIAAWTFTVGLAVWAAFPAGWRALRERHVVAQLAAAALLSIAVATLSGMSKAEVERIFLPFTIWIVALPMLLPRTWHRLLLLSQVVLALCFQQLLLTHW